VSAKDKLISARTSLVLDEPFFGSLVLGLALTEDATTPAAWVDGRALGYNPKFIDSLSHAQTVALLAHEVMHCAAGHPWRRDARDHKKFNVATDKAINGLLVDAGFTLPKNCMMPTGDEVGKSAEWIYSRLPEPAPQEDGDQNQDGDGEPGDGDGDGEPDPQGEVRDAPNTPDEDGEPAPSEADWQQATQQAALQARAQGKLPGGMARFAAEAVKPRIDWKSALRRFVQTYAASDFSWKQPNRRYIAQGLYLPSIESQELGEIAVAVDTSGSMDQKALDAAKAEIEQIIAECQPTKVTIYYADSRISRTDEFIKGEQIEWNPEGGGGTDFEPVCSAVQAQETAPACLIYITDLYGNFPATAPDVPVLWVTDGATHAPFGEVLAITD
jgi:predicted metal-dependent peptidase